MSEITDRKTIRCDWRDPAKTETHNVLGQCEQVATYRSGPDAPIVDPESPFMPAKEDGRSWLRVKDHKHLCPDHHELWAMNQGLFG